MGFLTHLYILAYLNREYFNTNNKNTFKSALNIKYTIITQEEKLYAVI